MSSSLPAILHSVSPVDSFVLFEMEDLVEFLEANDAPVLFEDEDPLEPFDDVDARRSHEGWIVWSGSLLIDLSRATSLEFNTAIASDSANSSIVSRITNG